jgi:hypothetical protein
LPCQQVLVLQSMIIPPNKSNAPITNYKINIRVNKAGLLRKVESEIITRLNSQSQVLDYRYIKTKIEGNLAIYLSA